MLLGWHDPDKKYPVRCKVRDAMDRYVEKFGVEPTTLLMNPSDWERFEQERAAGVLGTAPLNLAVETRVFLPRNTFYIGIEDAPEDER